MNDYALHQARFSGNLAGGGLLTRLIANWQARRGVASLAALDDHILRDIGVSRGDVEGLKHLPLGQNAVHALEELARLRRWGVTGTGQKRTTASPSRLARARTSG